MAGAGEQARNQNTSIPGLVIDAIMRSVEPLPDLNDLVRRPSWQRYAACRGQGIEEFFPEEGSGATRAAAICAPCPVAEECLAYALDNPALKGVWAGTSERRRRRMRMATGQIVSGPRAWSARRFEDCHKLDVLGHREQVESL